RVEPVGVHFFGRHAQEIVERRRAIPRILDVQFAGRLAEAGDGQDRRHLVPGDLFPALGDESLEQDIQTEQTPQPPGQPDVTEASQSLQPNVTKLDEDGFVLVRLIIARWAEQRRFWASPSFAIERPAELCPATLLTARKLPEIGDDAMPRAASGAIGLDQRPVDMGLAVLSPRAPLEEHDAIASFRGS